MRCQPSCRDLPFLGLCEADGSSFTTDHSHLRTAQQAAACMHMQCSVHTCTLARPSRHTACTLHAQCTTYMHLSAAQQAHRMHITCAVHTACAPHVACALQAAVSIRAELAVQGAAGGAVPPPREVFIFPLTLALTLPLTPTPTPILTLTFPHNQAFRIRPLSPELQIAFANSQSEVRPYP